ncbi:YjzD family protein [Bacillus halotolerans]|uniref:YjzD family protein n=1 Tax=Bacillus halotolerans TaxID=260554 RepID=UPI002DB5B5D6|nr:YjzD family protein [Bacillus halotolerans]MEC1406008.1 YjzD family protein [Bacillus halotolerans]
MRFIIAFIWTFLLSHMACYLIASMNSVAYNFTTSSVVAVVLYVLIMALAAIMPMNNNASQH